MKYKQIIEDCKEYNNYDDLSEYLNTVYKMIYTKTILTEFEDEVWRQIGDYQFQDEIIDFMDWDIYSGKWKVRRPKKINNASSAFIAILYWINERMAK